jgi:hypothetical protein
MASSAHVRVRRVAYVAIVLFPVLAGLRKASPPPEAPDPSKPMTVTRRGQPDTMKLPDRFVISLHKQYGYWKYRYCRLDIEVDRTKASATVECETLDGKRSRSSAELAAGTRTALVGLARASDLYGGDHVGHDFSPTDATFETLKIRPYGGGRAVVIVTSFNDRFESRRARRALLALLRDHELLAAAQR